jgi:hypothetical protein
MLWAFWYCAKLSNPISFKRGFLYLPTARLELSDARNGTTRIPMGKSAPRSDAAKEE